MKKRIYNMALLLGTMFLAACSDEVEFLETKAPEVEKEISATPEKDEENKSVASKAYEYSCPVTVTLETCGTLKDKILAVPEVDSLLSKVDKLVITGPLDANDVSVFLNEMSGLLSLDITETTFVENGLTFYNERRGKSSSYVLSLKENQIVNYMFYDTSLKEIKLPKGVTEIGDRAFYCYYTSHDALESVVLPEGLLSIGTYAFEGRTLLSELVLPQSIKSIGEYAFRLCYKLTINAFPGSLKTIGAYAFEDCDALTAVVLPESLESVGNYAFYHCSNLTSVTWPKSLPEMYAYVFRECVDLAEVNLPEGLVLIGSYTFDGCTSLKEINLPASLTAIYSYAFQNTGLTSIVVPDEVETIGAYAFSDCSSLAAVVLPEGLKTINNDAFSNCDALVKMDFLPESLTSLGTSVFSNCGALQEVVMPESVVELPSSTFQNCTALTKVTLSKSTTSIGSQAFYGCDALVAVDFLPESVSYIGGSAFGSCDVLTTVKLPDSLTEVESSIFSQCYALADVTLSQSMISIPQDMFYRCKSLKSVTVPESVITIGSRAFNGCENLESISLSTQTETIENYAFESCTNLKKIALPSSLKSIGTRAFCNAGLTEIAFPESLTSIGEGAFSGTNIKSVVLPDVSKGTQLFQDCTELTEVTVHGLVPSYCFSGCSHLDETKITLVDCKTIGSYAFQNTAITNLDFLPEGLATINSAAFSGCPIAVTSITFPSTLTYLGDNCLYGSTYKTVTSIRLSNTGNITVGDLFGYPSNCLVYTQSGSTATDEYLPNVVYNGQCGVLKLVEGAPFHCPESFTTSKVTFVKQFNRQSYSGGITTTKGQASNWYGLSLPFTVKKITASDGREFAPFNSGVEGAKPFWLRKLTPNGFENVTSIEAGEPYIIAFPNNESYADVYNVYGDVTFTATGNITIPVTEEKTVSGEYFTMKSGYDLKPRSGSVFLLNSPRYGNGYTYSPSGVKGNYNWGSTFVNNLRESWAFEAYVVGGTSASSYSVSPSVQSRSARVLGSVPNIDDM